MNRLLAASGALALATAFGVIGFTLGRSTAPAPSIDLVWTEAPGALTIAWSMDETDAIDVWFDGGRASTWRPP